MGSLCLFIAFSIVSLTCCISASLPSFKNNLELAFGFVVVVGIAALIALLIIFLARNLMMENKDYWLGYVKGLNGAGNDSFDGKSAEYIRGYAVGYEKRNKNAKDIQMSDASNSVPIKNEK